jgi:predicted phosphate transport protein (TIGR00153 family)
MSLNAFFQKLLPRDKKFFPLFESQSDYILEAAHLLKMLFEEPEYDRQVQIAFNIKELENKGDEVTHQVFNELDKTFITPFDREDIHQLVSTLDDVLDLINGVSQRVRLYRPGKFPPQFPEFAVVLIHGAEEIKKAVSELNNLKKPDRIMASCVRINELENLGDDLYHMVISDLFQNEKDAIELIKIKEVLQTIERACDRVEDVADVLKTIIIKGA